MASALTIILLSCWLAGHSGAWGAGREFLTPTIWPSRVVALGGSITIRYEGRYPGMKFFLRKALGLAERTPGRGAAEQGGPFPADISVRG
ncbi:unnamed protein product [Caretta caretta]